MNIYTHETERIRELQRQLSDAEQFRAMVREMRSVQKRIRYLKRGPKGPAKETLERRDRLQDAVDRELGMLDSD